MSFVKNYERLPRERQYLSSAGAGLAKFFESLKGR